MSKILIVGSGITGAATAALLRQNLPVNTQISVWEKAPKAGGRMSITSCPKQPSLTADLGAQYITLVNEYSTRRQDLYNELQSQGILKVMLGKIDGPNNFNQAGAKHFVTPNGTESLVNYFLQKASACIKYQHEVSEIHFDTASQVSVKTSSGVSEDFNTIILTAPVPEILNIKGTLRDFIERHTAIKKKLLDVTYSSRYAVGLFYKPRTELKYPWCVKYISENPCIRYIAANQAKRGVVDHDIGETIVIHTSVPFGLDHPNDNLDKVQSEILDHIFEILPDLPEPYSIVSKRWQYSQVHQAYEGKPGCVTLSTDPLIILAGDGFSISTFDGCLDSAESVLKAVANK